MKTDPFYLKKLLNIGNIFLFQKLWSSYCSAAGLGNK
jgi:hypothetical protein